jgi:K+-sensing histidine kinase KdpD
MGLGLMAARDIVSAHNGTLRLLDRDTRAAVFEIELPWQES